MTATEDAPTTESVRTEAPAGLARTISLPMLVFYGIGVTVGAGIFALVGEIVGIAGRRAPWSFLVAGAIAGLTGLCYAKLIARFPRAGGEAVFANRAFGPGMARIVGFGVVVIGTVSSAVISLAFAGYLRDLVAIPEAVVVVALIAGLVLIAARGVRESVVFAAAITMLEVGTLVVVAAYGLPLLFDGEAGGDVVATGGVGTGVIFAGAVVAFFAFVGFEDIANMAEETIDARRNGPRAIVITLVVTVVIYVLLAGIAVSIADPARLVDSDAPMATLFEILSGRDGRLVSAIAVVAMVNGVLVQIVMASRMLYGMSNEGLIPAAFARVHPTRHTPVRATFAVAGAIVVLALLFPLVTLARVTSLVTLFVFAAVDLSLVALATRLHHDDPDFGRARWLGATAAAAALGLAAWEIVDLAGG